MSLGAAVTTAAVGGAGAVTALNVPVPVSARSAVSEPALAWALQEASLIDIIDTMREADASAVALTDKLTFIYCEGRDMTPEASAKRLLDLRGGTTAAGTRLEREYAALFEPVQTVRTRLVATIASGDVSSGRGMPTAAEARAGRCVPVADVARLLAMDASNVASGFDAIVEALGAAEAAGKRLLLLYDGLDVERAASAMRLQSLALAGAAGLADLVTTAERAYAQQFERVREFRRAVAGALAANAPAALASGPAMVVTGGPAVLPPHLLFQLAISSPQLLPRLTTILMTDPAMAAAVARILPRRLQEEEKEKAMPACSSAANQSVVPPSAAAGGGVAVGMPVGPATVAAGDARGSRAPASTGSAPVSCSTAPDGDIAAIGALPRSAGAAAGAAPASTAPGMHDDTGMSAALLRVIAGYDPARDPWLTRFIAAPADVRRNMLGERLWPEVHRLQPLRAAKITGMLLELGHAELLHLLDAPADLTARVAEAVAVLGERPH